MPRGYGQLYVSWFCPAQAFKNATELSEFLFNRKEQGVLNTDT